MSAKSCSACNDLREYAPDFALNGVTDDVCENLAEDKGLSNAEGHVDCDDLHDVNDCLIGNLDDEVESFDVCEWKDFAHEMIPNLYETVKAMVCSICGQWSHIHCIEDAIYDHDFFTPIVTSPRSQGTAPTAYFKPANEDQTIKFYMDSVDGDDGSKVADKNYTCIISMCYNNEYITTNFSGAEITFHQSSDHYDAAYRNKYGMHVSVGTNTENDVAIPVTSACKVKKGDYLVCEVHPFHPANSSGQTRIHQVIITWIPDFIITPCDTNV